MNNIVQDLSGKTRDGYFSDADLVRTPNGIYFGTPGSQLFCGSFLMPSAITIEEWVVLSLGQRVITFFDGPFYLKLTDRAYWELCIGTSVYRVHHPISVHERHLIAVSHSFGDGSSILLSVDGKVLNGLWINGNGNDVVSGPAPFTVSLGSGDYLQQLTIANRAKTIQEIRDYIGGAV